jgi:hypothetical protein
MEVISRQTGLSSYLFEGDPFDPHCCECILGPAEGGGRALRVSKL